MDATQRSIEAAVTRQAAEWFVSQRAGTLPPAEREKFTAWLRTSPMHVREYLAVSMLARDVGAATESLDTDQLVGEARNDPHEDVSVVTPMSVRTALPAAADRATVPRARRKLLAAASIAVALLSLPWLIDRATVLLSPATLRTEHGEQRVWRLPDGSVVHLNSGSEIHLRFSRTERVVDVERGQALFDVARDVNRAFRVTAGAADVIALGTSFDVYRKPGELTITVVEGKVLVKQPRHERLDIVADGGGESAVGAADIAVTAGNQVRLSARRSAASPVSVDVARATAWTQQHIVFEQERLADVVQEFNRYGRMPMIVEGPALQDLRITGIFNAYDTDSFVNFLQRLDDVEVKTAADSIHIRKNSGT